MAPRLATAGRFFMSVLLGEFRTAVLAAAAEAVAKMQYQMMVESEVAIQEFEWEWKGPISNERSIIDTGRLMESIEPSKINVQQNSISFSLVWHPIDPEAKRAKDYADLVHDGQEGYFEGEDYDQDKEYTARPWTFLLMPAEQRDDSQLNTEIGPSVDSLPEDGWEACLKAFNDSFRQELSRTMKVIA